MVDPHDPRSPYRQVADVLRERIISREYMPGTDLPSTRELMEEFEVGNKTITSAVTVLKGEGLVEGLRGRGVRVRPEVERRVIMADWVKPPPRGEKDHWTAMGERAGRDYRQRITDATLVEPPGEVANLLNLGEGDLAVRRSRVMLIDGKTVEMVDSYYPPFLLDLAEGEAAGSRLREPRPIKGGALRLIADLGYAPHNSAREAVDARMPTPDEARTLDLPSGVPVLRVTRRVVAAEDEPIEVMVMLVGADRTTLLYDVPVH